MPWLAPFEDAPDSHRMWADPDTAYEAALHASGWCHEVAAPGSTLLTEQDGEQDPPSEQEVPPAEPRSADLSPVVERTAPEPKLKGRRRG